MSYITGEKEQGTAATLQGSHTENVKAIYSMFGLLHQSTAAPTWTVHHEWLDQLDRHECHRICWLSALGKSCNGPVVF